MIKNQVLLEVQAHRRSHASWMWATALFLKPLASDLPRQGRGTGGIGEAKRVSSLRWRWKSGMAQPAPDLCDVGLGRATDTSDPELGHLVRFSTTSPRR